MRSVIPANAGDVLGRSRMAADGERRDARRVDPGVFEVVGLVGALVGILEVAQRLPAVDRFKVRRRHARIERQQVQLKRAVLFARNALRGLRRSLEASNISEAPKQAATVLLGENEFELYAIDLERLYEALRVLSDTNLELERETAALPEAHEAYFRLTEEGERLTGRCATVLGGSPREMLDLLDEADKYLASCSAILNQNWPNTEI
jgi:hypothetical protein